MYSISSKLLVLQGIIVKTLFDSFMWCVRLSHCRTSVVSVCVMVPLLTVTWILGVIYFNQSTPALQYIFSLCNTLQVNDFFLWFICFAVCPSVRQCARKPTRHVVRSSVLGLVFRSIVCVGLLFCVTTIFIYTTTKTTSLLYFGLISRIR